MSNSTAHPTATALADQGYEVEYKSTVNADRSVTVDLLATGNGELALASSTASTATQATLDSLEKLQPLISTHAY